MRMGLHGYTKTWVDQTSAEGAEDRGRWHRDEEGGGDRVEGEMGQHRIGQTEHRMQKSPKQ